MPADSKFSSFGTEETLDFVAPILSQDSQALSTEVEMKTLKIFLFGFAILVFSGCYTELLIEDDPSADNSSQPQYVPYNPDTWYYYPPTYDPGIPLPTPGGPGAKIPGGDNGNTKTRDSGYQRRDANTSTPDNSRNTGVTRSGNDTGTQQQSPVKTPVVVPTRGDSGQQPATPQKNTQDSATPARSGRR